MSKKHNTQHYNHQDISADEQDEFRQAMDKLSNNNKLNKNF